MSVKLLKEPRVPSGPNTHIRSGTSYEYTYKKGATLVGGTLDLTVRIYLPDGVDPSVPLPCIVLFNIAAFLLSTSADTAGAQLSADLFNQCGVIVALVKVRSSTNVSLETDAASAGATNQLGIDIHAAIKDGYDAVKFIQSNPDTDNWTVDPRIVFIGGGSAGGIVALCTAIRYDDSLDLPGVLTWSAAFGFEDFEGIGCIEEVRTDLGFTEAGYLSSMPPICAFIREIDTVISSEETDPTWQSLLKDQVDINDGINSLNIVHYDDESGDSHDGITNWLEPNGLTDAATVEEALANFFIACCNVTPRFVGGIKLS